MAFTDEELRAIAELMGAASSFLDDDVVDETTGTIPLVDRLRKAIREVDRLMAEENHG